MYLDELPSTDFKGKRLDPTVFEKVSDTSSAIGFYSNSVDIFRCLPSNWDSCMSSCTLPRTCGSPLRTMSRRFPSHSHVICLSLAAIVPPHARALLSSLCHSSCTELKVRHAWQGGRHLTVWTYPCYSTFFSCNCTSAFMGSPLVSLQSRLDRTED